MKLRLTEEELREGMEELWSRTVQGRGAVEIRVHVVLSWEGDRLLLTTPHSYEPPPWKYHSAECVGAMKRYHLCLGTPDNV